MTRYQTEISCDHTPLFTIVMPAFNAARWIEEAVDSVRAQSVGDWEMIVVDDCSTDNTSLIISNYAEYDSRLRLLSTNQNSGGAFTPRRMAVENSRGRYIVMLDADDTLPPDYLEKLLHAIRRGKSPEMVLTKMELTTSADEAVTLPEPQVIPHITGPGRDLIKYTLNGWSISTTGAVDNALFRRAINEFDNDFPGNAQSPLNLDADELLTRYIFLLAGDISFAETTYCYRHNPDSVTKNITLSRFERLTTQPLLDSFIATHFPKNSETYRRNILQSFNSLWGAMTIYIRHKTALTPHRRQILQLMREAKSKINFRAIPRGYAPMRQLALRLGVKTALTLISIHDKIKRK